MREFPSLPTSDGMSVRRDVLPGYYANIYDEALNTRGSFIGPFENHTDGKLFMDRLEMWFGFGVYRRAPRTGEIVSLYKCVDQPSQHVIIARLVQLAREVNCPEPYPIVSRDSFYGNTLAKFLTSPLQTLV